MNKGDTKTKGDVSLPMSSDDALEEFIYKIMSENRRLKDEIKLLKLKEDHLIAEYRKIKDDYHELKNKS
jgi:hypothetical protein